MTDREGNTNAPRVEEHETGPRRVEEARRDREAHRGSVNANDTDRGTSWVSVVPGWLAALGAGLEAGADHPVEVEYGPALSPITA